MDDNSTMRGIMKRSVSTANKHIRHEGIVLPMPTFSIFEFYDNNYASDSAFEY